MSEFNHSQREQELHALAQRITGEIFKVGVCELDHADLAVIWSGESEASDAEKHLLVKNFSRQYGFLSVIDFGLSCAIFRGGV